MAHLLLFTFQDEQIDSGKQELSVGEIQQKVKDYNAQINSNLYMMVVSDEYIFFFLILCLIFYS